jgi:hypothetical protein
MEIIGQLLIAHALLCAALLGLCIGLLRARRT